MTTPPQSDLQLNILKVLSVDAVPKTATTIRKDLPVGGKPAAQELKHLLDRMASECLIVRFAGKKNSFVAAPIESWVRGTLLARLALGAQSEPKLKAALGKYYSGAFEDAIGALVHEGSVHVHPPQTVKGKKLYALTPADPLDYIAKDLQKLLTAAEKRGFARQSVRDAALRYLGRFEPTESSSPGTIIDAMRRLEPRVDHGVAVPIVRLREALAAAYEYAAFDAEILLLARQQVLELHTHPWPARLSGEEKGSLIDNGRGGWFDSAALPRRASP